MLDRVTAVLASLGCLGFLVAAVTPVAELGGTSMTMWGYTRERFVDPTGFPNDAYVVEDEVSWSEATFDGTGRLAWGSRLALASVGFAVIAVALWFAGLGRVPLLALGTSVAVGAVAAALLSSGMTAAAGEDLVKWRAGFYALWAATALLLVAFVGSLRPRPRVEAAHAEPAFDSVLYP